MCVETFFEEAEAVLIKSVLMLLKHLYQALVLLMGPQTNVKFLESIVLLTASRLFLK